MVTAAPSEVVVTFSTETWSDAVARDQVRPPGRLVETLVTSPDLRRLLVANPARHAGITAAKALLRRGEPELPDPPRGRSRLITPLALRRDLPTDLPSARRSLRRYDRQLEWAARRLGMERPSIITFNPLVAGMCALDWAGPVVYYARDDWTVHPRFAPWRTVVEHASRQLVRRGVAVAAVSTELLRRLGDVVDAAVICNGVDEGEWEDPPQHRQVDEGQRQLRFLYVGILDDRLDAAAIGQLATRYPTAMIHLVGPRRSDLGAVLAFPNVHQEEPPARERVIEIIRSADVCLVPHRRTALTEAMNPLKIYEYLAAGKPVAASDLAGSRDIHPKVHLVTGSSDLADTVAVALRDGPMPEDERQAFVRDNAWARRHEALFRFLRRRRTGASLLPEESR